MAQARMLRKEICESDSFATLKDSNSQLLLCLLTPWWSDHGKMIGDPIWIKGNIVRKLNQFTEKEIIRCLKNINDNTDAQWWQDEKGNWWLYWAKFNNHQTISEEKKSKDTIPSPKFPKKAQENPTTREVKLSIREDKRKGPGGPQSDLEFIQTLKTKAVYKHIDINRELEKMDTWLLTRPGRQKTRRFIVNWLNKIDKPVEVATQKPTSQRAYKPPVLIGERFKGTEKSA